MWGRLLRAGQTLRTAARDALGVREAGAELARRSIACVQKEVRAAFLLIALADTGLG